MKATQITGRQGFPEYSTNIIGISNTGATVEKTTGYSCRKVCFGLLVFVSLSFCEVLWKSSLSSTSQKLGYYAYPISFFVFFCLSIVYIIRQKLYSQCTPGHLAKILLYILFLTALLLYGLLRENNLNGVVHEAILFYSFAIFLVIGVNDKVHYFLGKLLTVVFWAAFILSVFTFDIEGPWVNETPLELREGFEGRYAFGIAYMFFRPFIDLGLPLFLLGLLERSRRWHYLKILSLVGYLIINVILFKFRHALALSVLVLLAGILMPSNITRKLKILSLAFVLIIVASSWIYTKHGATFVNRIEKFDEANKVVDYRLPELQFYFSTMGHEWLWGRGLGGTFYGGRTVNYKHPIRIREGLHIGWVSFTLKGGLLLFFIMLAFFAAGLRKNRKRLQYEPYYRIARFWIPIFFVSWLVNPVTFHAAYVPVYGLSFLLMAQFGKRSVAVSQIEQSTRSVP
jgi:hypothetical protein